MYDSSQDEELERGDAGPSVRFGRGATLRERLRLAVLALADCFERECDAGRATLWLPVLFGLGILGYFALPAEPTAVGLDLLTAALGIAAWQSRDRTVAFRVLLAVFAVVAGTSAMKFRTDLVDAPVLANEATLRLTGWVAGVETTANGSRLLVRVDRITGLRPQDTPRLVRVTTRAGRADYPVGSGVAMLAGLLPPPGPVRPGGYDFARQSFYAGIGAVGFSYGAPEPREIGPPPWQIRLRMPVERLRQGMGERIRAALPGPAGEMAVALLTGDRGGIPDETVEDLRDSGLAHILAISGLHMALLAGTAFWTIRALLALSYRLALTRPIKKWAAAAALVVAGFYLLISGSAIATQRAFIMIAVMFVAIMVDRRAITLRNVAVAALIVLVIAPESLVTASFQMSFAAVLALVSAYEALSARRDRVGMLLPTSRGLFGTASRATGSLAMTSLIAGLATTPFAVFHFQRVAPLALIANLLAMPLVSLVVMPFALMAIVLMPVGLEALPLWVMERGLTAVTWIAGQVAAWSASAGGVKAMPAAALLLMSFGLLWLALWRGRWRLLGLMPVAMALVMAIVAPVPDIIVGRDGAAAVRGSDGRYRILGKASAFEIENWLRADADTRTTRDLTLKAGVVCTDDGCAVAGIGDDRVVRLAEGAPPDECGAARVVIAAHRLPQGCRQQSVVIDGDDLARFGAHALYRERDGDRIETAYPAVRRKYMPPTPR